MCESSCLLYYITIEQHNRLYFFNFVGNMAHCPTIFLQMTCLTRLLNHSTATIGGGLAKWATTATVSSCESDLQLSRQFCYDWSQHTLKMHAFRAFTGSRMCSSRSSLIHRLCGGLCYHLSKRRVMLMHPWFVAAAVIDFPSVINTYKVLLIGMLQIHPSNSTERT